MVKRFVHVNSIWSRYSVIQLAPCWSGKTRLQKVEVAKNIWAQQETHT
jgi:hypothetical protein